MAGSTKADAARRKRSAIFKEEGDLREKEGACPEFIEILHAACGIWIQLERLTTRLISLSSSLSPIRSRHLTCWNHVLLHVIFDKLSESKSYGMSGADT